MEQPSASSQESSLFEMEIDALAQMHLRNISKWGQFIGIVMMIFIAIAIIALAAYYRQVSEIFSAYLSLDNTTTGIVIGMLVFIGALCVIWLIYLLKCCAMIKQGLLSQNSERVAEGFKSLKTAFIIGIILSVLSVLSTLISMINI